MLNALSIENIILIKRLDLVFESGLTVLTGETGTGKSILLDALYLALGERADTSLIRLHENEAVVTACFSLSTKDLLSEFLEPLGLSVGDSTLIVRRHISRTGPSRAFINDKPVTLGTLKAVTSQLLDIHGQFDRLLEPSSHGKLLDNYGNHDQLLRACEIYFQAWRDAEKILGEARSVSLEKTQRLAFLTMALGDLDRVSYKPHEEKSLQENRLTASHFSKLQELARHAYSGLYGARGAQASMSDALVTLDKIHEMSPNLFKPLGDFLDSSSIDLQEQELSLKEFCESSDTYDFEAIDQRLYDLKSTARKYGIEISDLASLQMSFSHEFEKLSGGATGMETLEKTVSSSKEAYTVAAKNLSDARRKAAKDLDTLLKNELVQLKLERAHVIFDFAPLESSGWSKTGTERITLMIKMNEGSAFGPLAKIASGGERSRLMLALKTVLNQGAEDFTQIFDEIDTGMSGAAAASVGASLKKLSNSHQVLSISHAPQVAAAADHHWRVQKNDIHGETLTTVTTLKGQWRIEEIARLLSGDTITPEAKLAASALFAKRA